MLEVAASIILSHHIRNGGETTELLIHLLVFMVLGDGPIGRVHPLMISTAIAWAVLPEVSGISSESWLRRKYVVLIALFTVLRILSRDAN